MNMKKFKPGEDIQYRMDLVNDITKWGLPTYIMAFENLSKEDFATLYDIAVDELDAFSYFQHSNDGLYNPGKINTLKDNRINLVESFRRVLGYNLATKYNGNRQLLAIAFSEMMLLQPCSDETLKRSEALNYYYSVRESSLEKDNQITK